MARLNKIETKQEQLPPKERYSTRIINCQIKEGKLITQLDDGREVSILVSLLAEQSILDKNVKPEQLEKMEIHKEGRYIYFPVIDEILPAWIISQGPHSSCFLFVSC
ncbi:hypothetical protein [endosymbiont GvMRE of Glomus versiforme]|uniref:hypothetical protein n=1 Tax=endosymbiont GvMRE of Glomus versiforme TaxID=2039283 RepID=UPI000EC22A4B|nr:hypothetical protein [endosymbiont GvMRE of Glomus versiforme]RHZ35194.1 hypothetical protein GvMRE_IIg487 [endosymbiont GvMRE of Glomus versiforme]